MWQSLLGCNMVHVFWRPNRDLDAMYSLRHVWCHSAREVTASHTSSPVTVGMRSRKRGAMTVSLRKHDDEWSCICYSVTLFCSVGGAMTQVHPPNLDVAL